MYFIRSVATCILMLLVVSISFGQETTGSIEGVVKDGSGAVVPGITVTVRSTGTSAAFRRKITTYGSLNVRNVPLGPIR